MADPPASRRWTWRDPRPWLALVSLAAVLTLFLWETERTLPPPISAVHAQERGLASTEGCHLCHGDGERTRREACFACHEDVEAQFADGQGLHGLRVAGRELDCGHCHIEHAGREFPLVGEHSFARAGFARRAEFDHPFEGYDVAGAHDDLECAACHEHADLALLPPGARRFLGLSRDCESCHGEASPHEGRMLRSCASCHGQERPFAEVAEFEHDPRFELSGVHAVAECAACHERGTPTSIETLASAVEPPAVRACASCHEVPHAPESLANAALLGAHAGGDACSLCHLDGQSTFPDAGSTLTAALHEAFAFDLEAPHGDLECAECHGPELPWEARFPGRARRDCAACHEDAHGGQFDGEPTAACVDCHGDTAFVPARFDLEQHGRCAFPLEGAHQAVTCNACHELPADGGPRTWRGVPRDCAACHADAHDGRFVEEDGALTDCADCHGAQAFGGEATAAEFDHGHWTSFPLDGAHGALECAACHEASAERDAAGRRFGRVADVFGGSPTAARPCADCHADAHEVDFDAPGRPAAVDGRRGCARCHDSTSWRAASAAGFDHQVWTERRLGGAHLELECTTCHRRSARPDHLGRSFGRVRERFGQDVAACATCHGDPHGGLFDGAHAPAQVDGREGCVRCHGERRFLPLTLAAFDHDLWTDTDLASGHRQQTCDDCHPRLAQPGPAARGRAVAQGRACDDCHNDPHAGQFAEKGRNDCRRCHGDQGSWAELDFDHDRDSRFALDAVHAPLACDDCHSAAERPGLAALVRYKPLGVECVDCHGVPGEDPPR